VLLRVKQVLVSQEEKKPAVAVGLWRKGVLRHYGAYVAASKQTRSVSDASPGPVRLHLGAGWDRYANSGDEGVFRGYLGMEAALSPTLTLLGEVGIEEKTDVRLRQPPYSIGLRYGSESRGSLSLGLVRPGFYFANEPAFMIALQRALPARR
jgi:hypothetical protein